jgi:hypothetical protein
MDRRWSPAIEDIVLDIVAKTGSPKKAAEVAGVSTATIHDHRVRDFAFGQMYAQAMDQAFHAVLGKAFDRSLDEVEPSDRLIEILLKFRWPERLQGFLNLVGEPQLQSTEPMGLDPRVIAKMAANDRTLLIGLLEKYLDLQEGQKHGQSINQA